MIAWARVVFIHKEKMFAIVQDVAQKKYFVATSYCHVRDAEVGDILEFEPHPPTKTVRVCGDGKGREALWCAHNPRIIGYSVSESESNSAPAHAPESVAENVH